MKTSSIILLLVLLTFCQKPDFDYSLIEPRYEQPYLSAIYLDGQLVQTYHWNTDKDRVDTINYYDNDRIYSFAKLEHNSTQKPSSITYYSNQKETDRYEYTYDEKNRLKTVMYCNNQSFCSTKKYYYSDRNQCPLDSIVETSSNFKNQFGSYVLIESRDYKNYSNCSCNKYFFIDYDNDRGGYIRYRTEITEYSPEFYVNPYFQIFPEQQAYLDWNILKFDNIEGKLLEEVFVKSIEYNLHSYPTHLEIETYDANNKNSTIKKYRFEYD